VSILNLFYQYRVTTYLTGLDTKFFSNGTTAIPEYAAFLTTRLPQLTSSTAFNVCHSFGGEQWMHTVTSMNQTIEAVLSESAISKSILLGVAVGSLVYGLRNFINAGRTVRPVVDEAGVRERLRTVKSIVPRAA